MKSLLLILVSLLLWSCTMGEVNPELMRAYKLLYSAPDSALQILNSIPRSGFSRKQQAQYALFYSMAQDKSGLDVDRDTLLRVAYDYYKNRPDDSLYAKSNYYMGLFYQKVDSSKRAADCFYNAIHASSHQHDLYTQYLACNRLSWEIYIVAPDEGLRYAKEAYRLYGYLGEQNPSNEVYLLLQVVNCFMNLDRRDSATIYLGKALNRSMELNDASLQGSTYLAWSHVYDEVSMSDSALYYAKLHWRISDYKEPANYSYLARCYLNQDSLTQAESLYRQILNLPASIYTRYTAYNGLLNISIMKKDCTNLQQYSDSAQSILKQIYQFSTNDNVNYRKEKEELMMNNTELDTSLKTSRYGVFVLVLLLLFVISLACCVFLVYRNTVRQKQQEEKQRSAMMLEQERHRHEMEEFRYQKESELLKYQHSMNLERQRNQLMHTERELSMMKNFVLSKMQYGQELEQLRNEKRIHELSQDDWLELELFLNESASGFMTEFRECFPWLKEKDFQLCMLLKLDFNNQELTRFYGIMLESVKHKLLMLKSKLGIEKSSFSARDFIKSWNQDR